MLTTKTKKALTAGLAATALGAGLMAGSATADPAQYSAYVGVGSDTTQDVMNALAGRSAGVQYTPLVSSSATGALQIISFDATAETAGAGDNCITTKTGAPALDRPNGSSNGRRALSRALDGTGWGNTTICGRKDISGLVDFARSSAGPTAGDTGTALTYVPFGRDAMSFAYYRQNGTPVTTLTRAQLTQLFTTGPQTIDGVEIIPCGIQTGSGTFQFWNSVTTATTGQESTATSYCNNLALANGFNTNQGGRAQESNGPDLRERGQLVAAQAGKSGAQVVIGFSAGQYIARSNGRANPAPGAGVFMGSISNNGSGADLGNPITGTAPNLAPNTTFFDDGVFGRNVYNVFDSNKLGTPGDAALKNMFVDTNSDPAINTAVICNAPYTATISALGFSPIATCGSTTLKGSLFSGQQNS